MRIAIDTGGTFTDCVYLNNGTPAVLKLLSTPADPAKSVLESIRAITARAASALQARAGSPLKSECLEVRHGTTIGTNALLERKGARVAFVTTSGFEDTISIGRQARQDLYNWMATPKPCLVPPELRFGVNERVSAEGKILISPGAQDLAELSEKVRLSGAESLDAIPTLWSSQLCHSPRLRGARHPLSQPQRRLQRAVAHDSREQSILVPRRYPILGSSPATKIVLTVVTSP